MSLPFIDRHPTPQEVEKLRLLLSTYQDGSGGTKVDRKNPNILSFPDSRDFERCIALTFNGEAPEGKRVFDVIFKDENGVEYGISCKMKGDDAWKKLIPAPGNQPYIHMELSNASGDFRDALIRQNINLDNYTHGTNPYPAGRAVVNLVKIWHRRESLVNGGSANLLKSYFLAMVYEIKSTKCSIFQMPLYLPNPRALTWYCPTKISRGQEVPCKRIQGDINGIKIFDYYGTSGGQLKYYYPLSWPIVWSCSFMLEPLPTEIISQDPALRKASSYFNEAWQRCIEMEQE